MGASDLSEAELPERQVTIPSFELMKTEVTVAQYRACLKHGSCSEPDSSDPCNWGQPGRDDHPINCVDWDQASKFAAWANARLPSEAEWEFAARSEGRDQKYPWGDAEPTCAYSVILDGNGEFGCGTNFTAPVCSKSSGNSAQGVCDLAGNVGEWVADLYGPYDEAPTDGSAMSGAAEYRVFRGGGSLSANVAGSLRAARRNGDLPGYRLPFLGFRLAR